MTDKVEMMTVDQSVVICSKFIKLISTALTRKEAERLINLLTVDEQRIRLEINEVISNLVVDQNEVNLEDFTAGSRVYKIIYFTKEKGDILTSRFMVERAGLLNASISREYCSHVLKYQNDIPVGLRRKIVIVFTDYRSPANSDQFAYLIWDKTGLVQKWHHIEQSFGDRVCVVRCIRYK